MELSKVTGIVLSSAPIGEYDRRVVLLTREDGKFPAFARGARRQNSTLLAATMPFACGSFYYYAGRSSNTIMRAEIDNYFPDLHEDLDAACYGFYFLELAGYVTSECSDEFDMLKLLYQSLRALSNPHIPRRLTRVVFEWKTLVINGTWPDPSESGLDHTAVYTLDFIRLTAPEKLYTFTVSDAVLDQLEPFVQKALRQLVDRPMKSLDMLEKVQGDRRGEK